jgi:hypothetical protein
MWTQWCSSVDFLSRANPRLAAEMFSASLFYLRLSEKLSSEWI